MNFRLTLAQLKKDVRCINRTVFENKLNLKSVILEIDYDLRAEWGYCVPEEEDVIYLGVAGNFPSMDFYHDILVHELIHLYQFQILEVEPDHGATFRRTAKQFGIKSNHYVMQ